MFIRVLKSPDEDLLGSWRTLQQFLLGQTEYFCAVDILLSCHTVCQCQTTNGILEYFKGYYLLIS